MERRVAIGCPEHDNCVATFACCLPEELGDRKRMRLPDSYHSHVVGWDVVPFEVFHDPTTSSGDVMALRLQLEARVAKLERFASRRWLDRRWMRRG